MTKIPPLVRLDFPDCPKGFRRIFCASKKTKYKSFLAAACTWSKILLRLQVWNLFAEDEQIMHAADCKKLAESPVGDFRQAKKSHLLRGGISILLFRCFHKAAEQILCLFPGDQFFRMPLDTHNEPLTG